MLTSMTLPAIVRRYFADPIPADDGFFATCPACSTPHALRIAAWPGVSGASLYCTRPECPSYASDSDSENGPLDVIADALDVSPSTLYAHLAAVRVAGDDVAAEGSLDSLLLSRDDLKTLPPPEPLIEGILNKRTLSFVAGAPATGKSFLLLDWSACIATGTPWNGREAEEGRVLYIVGEGVFGIDARLSAWEEHHGKEIPGDRLMLVRQAVQIHERQVHEWLCRTLAEGGYTLLVIDTLARTSLGLNESDSDQMSQWVEKAEALGRAMDGGSVVVAHHSSRAQPGLRGSSALDGAAEHVFLTHKRSDGRIVLAFPKVKDGPEPDPLDFDLLAVADSAVLSPASPDDSTEPDLPGRMKVWRALSMAFGHGAQTFTRPEARTVAVYPAGDPDPALVSRATFNREFNALLGAGVVGQVATTGRSSDRFHIDKETAAARHFPLYPDERAIDVPPMDGAPF